MALRIFIKYLYNTEIKFKIRETGHLNDLITKQRTFTQFLEMSQNF